MVSAPTNSYPFACVQRYFIRLHVCPKTLKPRPQTSKPISKTSEPKPNFLILAISITFSITFSLRNFDENASPLVQTPLWEIKKNSKFSLKNLYKIHYFFHYTIRKCERARIFCLCLQIGSEFEKVPKPLQ